MLKTTKYFLKIGVFPTNVFILQYIHEKFDLKGPS